MCRLIPVKSLISPLVPPPPLLPLQGFKVGYVVFQTASSVSAAKSHPRDEPLVVCTEERQVKTGSQSEWCIQHVSQILVGHVRLLTRLIFFTPEWIEQYTKSFSPPDKLQEIVDSFMAGYDKRIEEVRPSPRAGIRRPSSPSWPPTCFCLSSLQEADKQREEAKQQQDDEEGWVKVTRGPKGAKGRPHSEAANKRTLQKEIRKRKRKELMNFYTWQHRNTQKEREWSRSPGWSLSLEEVEAPSSVKRLFPWLASHVYFLFPSDIADLRKKFEEDKQKIALLRAQRKFRPYWGNYSDFTFLISMLVCATL